MPVLPPLNDEEYELMAEAVADALAEPDTIRDDAALGETIETLKAYKAQQSSEAFGASAEEQDLAALGQNLAALGQKPRMGTTVMDEPANTILRAHEVEGGAIPSGGWGSILGNDAPFTPQQDDYSLARARSITQGAPIALPNQTGHPALFRPPRHDGDGSVMETTRWMEPSVEQVREYLKPYLGAGVGHVTEDSEEYKRAADFMYSRDYDKAVAEGRGVQRVAFVPAETLLEKGKRAGQRGANIAGGFAAGALDSGTLGISSRLSDRYREMQLHEPTAAAVGLFAGLLSPTGAPGYIFRALGKAGLKGGEKAIGGAAGRLAGSGVGAGSAAVLEGGARDVAETVGTDEFGGRMEALPETSFLRALGGFGLGAGTQGLSEAARGGAVAWRGSDEALDDALNYSEMRGSELSGFGKTRAPPVDAELRAAGRGFTSVDEASMRALEGVPSQGALVDSLGARIGDRAAVAESIESSLPAVDQLAAKASGRLAVAGANRHADTQTLVGGAKHSAMEDYILHGNPAEGVAPNALARPGASWRAISSHAVQRAWTDLPYVNKKPIDMKVDLAEVKVYGSEVEAQRVMTGKIAKETGAELKTLGDWASEVGQGGKATQEKWAAMISEALPHDVLNRLGMMGGAKTEAGAAYLRSLPAIAGPKPISLAQLEKVWQPAVNYASKAATDGVPADAVATDTLIGLYRDRSLFKVRVPDSLKKAAGTDKFYVETPGGGPAEEVTGWGAVVKAEADVLGRTDSTLRQAGFPRSMPARMPAKAPGKVRNMPAALGADDYRALQSNSAGYTGARPQDAALDELAAGDAELQALLKLTAAKNNAGPGAALRYGLPGSERTSKALEATGADPAKLAEQKMLNALGDKRAALTGYDSGAAGQAEKDDIIRSMFVPAGSELDILGMLNRAGGSREAIMGKIHPKGVYDMEQMGALRALLKHTGKGQDLQDMETALGAARLRAATNQPELRAQGGSGGIPGIGVGTFNSAPVSVVGRVAYPWLRALGSSPSEFPVPGRNQAARFGKGLALRGQPTGLPALGDMIGPERREELKAWLRRNLELTE